MLDLVYRIPRGLPSDFGRDFRSRPDWGRGWPRQTLRAPSSCRPPGPRSCQLARYPRTLPPPLRRPLCPSWCAGFLPIPTKSGASRASGLICGSWERRRPGPASAASRSLQKIVGAIVGAASRTGREHLQGSSPPPVHLRRLEPIIRAEMGAPTTSRRRFCLSSK